MPYLVFTQLIHTALVSIHQAMHATKEGEERLLAPVDNNGNTIAHLAVERGLVSIFKVMIVCACACACACAYRQYLTLILYVGNISKNSSY